MPSFPRVARFAAITIPLATAVLAGRVSAQPMSADAQITSAVLALPAELQADAGVLGYRSGTALEQLRPSKNGMLCLADDPADDQFHVACYHNSMEPFMARGRSLRAGGTKGTAVDSVRFAEVKSGKIKMPKDPATLYQIFAPKDAYSAGKVTGGRRLTVVYIPFATEASTGLSIKSSATAPWLMFPGTPKAHIMFSSSM
ncbi:MAG TPA: hypothetical protein VE869_11740 [Gemmatimonas sp.]|nr:hypothetical protein [Gemmatimonas sp.]